MMTLRHTVPTLALAIALALPGGEALAQWRSPDSWQPAPTSSQTEDRVTKRYGIQILLMDAGVITTAIATEQGAVFVGGYLLGGPLVHVANGNPKQAVGSLLLRAGLPTGGILLGAIAAESHCEHSDEMFCGLGEIAAGMLVGMVTATVIDAAVLAKKTTKVERDPALFSVGSVAANPDVRVTREGSVTLGFTGRF